MSDELADTIVDSFLKKTNPYILFEDENLFLRGIARDLLSKSLSDMPLFINKESNFIQYVAMYRMENNI